MISSCLSSTPPTVHCTQRKHTQIQTHVHTHKHHPLCTAHKGNTHNTNTQTHKHTILQTHVYTHTCVGVCRFTNNKQIHKHCRCRCKHTHAHKGIQMQTPTCFTHTHRCKCRCMENAEIVAWVTFYFEGWEVAQVRPRHVTGTGTMWSNTSRLELWFMPDLNRHTDVTHCGRGWEVALD